MDLNLYFLPFVFFFVVFFVALQCQNIRSPVPASLSLPISKEHHLCRILRHQRCQLAQRPPTPATSQPEASAESLAPCRGPGRHPGNSSAAHVHPPREAKRRGAWSILHQSAPLRYYLYPFILLFTSVTVHCPKHYFSWTCLFDSSFYFIA